MYKMLTYEEFVDTYKPINNHLTKYPNETNIAFETYGEEVDFVKAQPNNLIWTELDGDGGGFIVSGYHYVNRIQYYVATVPIPENVFVEVCVELYKDCECSEEGEGSPNCVLCEGNGQMSIYPDTREELAELFGEKIANATY
jgi:hypothetical protein